MAKTATINPRVVSEGTVQLSVKEELLLAKAERAAGYVGRTLDEVMLDMERIIARAENGEI